MRRDRSSGLLRGTTISIAGALTVATALLAGPLTTAAAFPPLPGDPPAPPGQDPRSPRPDIVVIVLDDIPELDGRLWTRLPDHRAHFVEQGVRFSDAHGETPTCCPGRAGFLTGLHTHHHGTYLTDGSLFQPGETIATELQRVGYHTIQVGKYLNLFERVYPKWPPGWDEFHGFGGDYFGYTMWSDGVPHRYGNRPRDYSTDVIARLSLGRSTASRATSRSSPGSRRSPCTSRGPSRRAHRHAKGCRPVALEAAQLHGARTCATSPPTCRRDASSAAGGYRLTRICRGLRSVDELVRDGSVRKLDRHGPPRQHDAHPHLGQRHVLRRAALPQRQEGALRDPDPLLRPLAAGARHACRVTVGERIQNIDLAPTLCDIAGCELGPYPTGQTQARRTLLPAPAHRASASTSRGPRS